MDKRYSEAIELVWRQYSGKAHATIKGIGVVTCIYVNPELNALWMIDYRIYASDGDGKNKLTHVQEMLTHTRYHKQLSFRAVLMDTWYATKGLMLFIESLGKVYYCPLKCNRQVDESGDLQPYQRVDALEWNQVDLSQGKTLKIRGFPKTTRCSVFGLRCLPTARTSLSPTIRLNPQRRTLKMRAASAGELQTG